MSPEKQRIAIADYLGWEAPWVHRGCNVYPHRVTGRIKPGGFLESAPFGIPPGGKLTHTWKVEDNLEPLPAWTTDLNESIKLLIGLAQQGVEWLIKPVGDSCCYSVSINGGGLSDVSIINTGELAPIICECYLRAIGKWEE